MDRSSEDGSNSQELHIFLVAGHMISCTAAGAMHHGTVSQKERNDGSSGTRVVLKPPYVVPARESRGLSVVMVIRANRCLGGIDSHLWWW